MIKQLRVFFGSYGVLEELANDGATVYVAKGTQEFLKVWGVQHWVSSAYFPHSNLWTETAVKSMKRLISQNTGTGGTLDSDKFTIAILTYWNTLDRDMGVKSARLKCCFPDGSRTRSQ